MLLYECECLTEELDTDIDKCITKIKHLERTMKAVQRSPNTFNNTNSLNLFRQFHAKIHTQQNKTRTIKHAFEQCINM